MPHPKHSTVRKRYREKCGYCGVTEIDCGGELTVDHFVPVVAGGDESDGNLVYCCSRCNLYKGRFIPTGEHVIAGRRVLHPQLDRVKEHIRESKVTGLLEPLSVTGAFHIGLLQLNRQALVDHRQRNTLIEVFLSKHNVLTQDLEWLDGESVTKTEYLRRLRELFGI